MYQTFVDHTSILGMASHTEYPSFGPTCGTCHRPDPSNMTWQDGIKNFFSTFFATPRMWPVGYILGSPYSPLRLEREIPSRNWRDAFEDLLALENGRQMIAPESRKAEDQYASKDRFELASRAIAISNSSLQELAKLKVQTLKDRQTAERERETHIVKWCDDHLLPSMQAEHDELTASARSIKALYEKNINATASSLKLRGQWIASLMNSGALPGWEWTASHTVDGPLMIYHKTDRSADMVADISILELELKEIFEDGQPYKISSPALLPPSVIKALTDSSIHNDRTQTIHPDPLRKYYPSPSSILKQAARAEPVKLRDGSTGTKVFFENQLADGTIVKKEFVQEPAKVFEEVEDAGKYMDMFTRTIIAEKKASELDQAYRETFGYGNQEAVPEEM